MNKNDDFQECGLKKCCGADNSITEREEMIIQLSCQFILGNTSALKDSIIKAKLMDFTTEDIEKICLLSAENAKSNVLMSVNIKSESKKNNCCI